MAKLKKRKMVATLKVEIPASEGNDKIKKREVVDALQSRLNDVTLYIGVGSVPVTVKVSKDINEE